MTRVIIPLNPTLMADLHSLACDAIKDSHDAAFNYVRKSGVTPSQREPKYVAHLCREMKDVAQLWGTKLPSVTPGLHLSMATVFTHQTPYVHWHEGGKMRRCELADLLIAVIDRTTVTPTGTAVLIQAKLSANKSIQLSSLSEVNQFDLLAFRPAFDLDRKDAPKGVDLTAYTPDHALLYGLTTDTALAPASHFPYPHFWLTAQNLQTPKSTPYLVDAEDCLAFSLVGMLVGNCGWEFKLPPKGAGWKHFSAPPYRDHWSMLINYILRETFGGAVPKATQVSIGRTLRGAGEVVCMATRNPVGQRSFFLSYDLDAHIQADCGIGENGASGDAGDEWDVVDPEVLFMDGDNGGGPDKPVDEAPDGGGAPLSAILFDFSRR